MASPSPLSSSAAGDVAVSGAVPGEFKRQPRLPTFAVPRRYALTLSPDLDALTFTGAVTVNIDVTDPTRFLVLNSLDLVIDDSSVVLRVSDREIRPRCVSLDVEDEILVIDFGEVIPIGGAVLGIGFSGVLNDHMRGFYRSKYEVDGVKRIMAVTQLEAVEARRCFPCWDEPALKATFKVTVEVPSELIALSNMPVANEIVHGHSKTVHFEESPIMSTYLVAVVVGLFDYIEDLTPDGIKVRVYCQTGKSDQGKFGLHVAVRSLELYKKYFSVPFSLPKMDLVVIPDFDGAMENYGLITFHDTALLYDEKFSSAANKQWVATAVAHEVAHQWFGNLVTMEWWTHLWLKEGFATWVSYLAIDSFFPKWNIWTQYLELINGGIKLDALAESHPIEVEILRAREIDEIFDAISYKKGCSIIKMLQAYLGYDIFQKSIAVYIKRYAGRNAKTDDLWRVLSEESGVPVKRMMDTWTKQKGYPVVHVKSNGGLLEVEQSQFFSSGLHGDSQWIVPVTLCVGSYDTRKSFLLDSKETTLDISSLLCPSNSSVGLIQHDAMFDCHQSWIKVNVEQAGFYRVKYDDTLAARLRVAIDGDFLSATDKFGVLDDSFALCEACEQPLSYLLLLMDVYRKELNYTVLSRLIHVILKVTKVSFSGLPDLLHNLKQFFISILQVSSKRLGWDLLPGEGHENGLLRGECLTALVILGHEITSEEARRRFHAFLEDRNTPLLPPDIRKAVFTAVMRTVTASDRRGLDLLLNVYRDNDIAQEKGRILSAMTSSRDPNILLETLDFLLSPEVRDQDVIYGLAGISWEGSETAWCWMKEKWELIEDRWGHHFLLARFILNIVTQFATDEKADEIEEFFLAHPKPSIARTLRTSIEQVRVNARWALNMGKANDIGRVKFAIGQVREP